MLSLKQCSQVLNENGKNYTEDEVKAIRGLLYQLAKIEHEQDKRNKTEKSNYIHKGFN